MNKPKSTTFADLVAYKLRSRNELYAVQKKRYFHVPDGELYRSVEMAADLRIACRCGTFSENLKCGLGPCSHAAEAIEFVDNVGWRKLPTWTLAAAS